MKLIKKTSSYRFLLMTNAYDKWLKKEERALDVGCGRGTITKMLTDHYKLKMYATDIKNYLIYDIPFRKMSKDKLPLYNKKFDVIFLNDVLHHIPKEKQEDLIKQSLKLAKKVLIFEMKPTLMAKIWDYILNKLHYSDLKTPLAFRDIKAWEKLFKKIGAKNQAITIRRPLWYPFSHIAFCVKTT